MKDLFVGIDPSLTNTGLVILNEEAEVLNQELIMTSSKEDIEVRLIKIRDHIMYSLTNDELDKFFHVCIEGLSFMSKGQGFTQLAGLHYFLRTCLYQRSGDIEYKVIAPTSLKKFVFKGNAKKELMLLKIFKRWGTEFEDSNLADAYGLARMSLDSRGQTLKEK